MAKNNDLPHAWESAEMPFGDDNIEPTAYETCQYCGRDILEGEWFHLIDGNPICAECLDERKRKAG